jgi:hypothetical protein
VFGDQPRARALGAEGDPQRSFSLRVDREQVIAELVERGPFGSPGFDAGFDRITDFSRSSGDKIDLRGHFEATTFAELKANASQFATDTHLRLGDDTIVLEDVALSQVTEAMFIL